MEKKIDLGNYLKKMFHAISHDFLYYWKENIIYFKINLIYNLQASNIKAHWVDTIKVTCWFCIWCSHFFLLQRWQGIKMFYCLYCVLLLPKLIDPTVYTPDTMLKHRLKWCNASQNVFVYDPWEKLEFMFWKIVQYVLLHP